MVKRGAGKRKPVGKAGGRKKKKKGGLDWYTSDSAVGLFQNLGHDAKEERRKLRRQKQERRRGEVHDDGEKRTGRATFSDDDEDDIAARSSGKMASESESEGSAQEEDDSGDEASPYGDLLSSLESSKASLDKPYRSVLRRVLNEQQGIEDASDSDEDSEAEGSDAKEPSADEDEDEDEDEDGDGDRDEDMEETVSDKADSEAANGADEADEAEEEADTGTHFERRFVKSHGLDEDGLERAAADSSAPTKQRCKVPVDGRVYTVTCVGCPATEAPVAFQAAAVDTGEESVEAFVKTHQVRSRLAKRWLEYAKRRDKLSRRRLGDAGAGVVPERNALGLTRLQAQLQPHLEAYRDVLFADRSLALAPELRESYVLHVLNHAFKSAELVTKHSNRLKTKQVKLMKQRDDAIAKAKASGDKAAVAKALAEARAAAAAEDEEEEEVVRDQGFTRPKALILVPNRLAALRVVRLMLELLPENVAVANKTRFWDAYSEAEPEDAPKDVQARIKREKQDASESYDELYLAAGQHPLIEDDLQRRKGATPRPGDWHATFTGNHDECFRMGIGIQSRKSVRLFCDFYRSDIIIASPVGLRLATGQSIGDETGDDGDEADEADDVGQDEVDEALGLNVREEETRQRKRKRKEETDFLSSIEVCVVDQADVFEMQNWQHLADVMGAVNRKPIELRAEMDFARIRHYHLVEGLARRFRQTLLFSSYPMAFANALALPASVSKMNLAGLVSWRPASYEDSLGEINVPGLAHKFIRVPETRLEEDGEAEEAADPRLDYFAKHVLKALKRRDAEHTLVVAPSFLEYVSLRNLLRRTAQELGDVGNRARGKPWAGKNKNRARGRDGRRILRSKDAGPEQALFVAVSEYTEPRDMSRARSDFFEGRARILLTTERFHFYHRFRLRGIRRIVFYAPPQHASFYTELCNLVERSPEPASNLTLFDSVDALALERVVGTRSARSMLSSSSTVFEVSSDDA